MIRCLKLALSFAILLALIQSLSAAQSQPPRKYDVAAYYWPGYHPEPRWQPLQRSPKGEWEIIRAAKPRFEGHYQPRVPLWGYENEADPNVMEKKIDAAVTHGVNVLIFDWYWYDNKPFLESCINNGYLKAGNNDKIHFFLMWANHPAMTHVLERGEKRQIVWPGAVDRPTFDTIVRRVITMYFKHPSYYKIDGKPVFTIYQISTLIEGLGGIENTRQALDHFRQEVVKVGFPGLHIQAVLWDFLPASKDPCQPDAEPSQNNTVKALGIDSVTNYQFVHVASLVDDYTRWCDSAVSFWPLWEKQFSVPYFPHVSIGWDSNPRSSSLSPLVKNGVTPDNFKLCLKKAKAWADAHPDQPPLITINSWNEWSEGSYLEPDQKFGMGYLQAVKEAFDSNISAAQEKKREDKAYNESVRTEVHPKTGPVVSENVIFQSAVTIGRTGDHNITADLFRPKQLPTAASPAIIFLHGGAWKFGSPSQFHYHGNYFASKYNFLALSVDYRLSGVAPFPAALQDAKCAVRWIRANAKRFNVNPEKIAICGGSAGGHLTSMVAVTAGVKDYEGDGGWQQFDSHVNLAVIFNGEFDMWDLVKKDSLIDTMAQFIGGTPQQMPEKYDELSSIKRIHPKVPPVLLLHGTADQCVSHEQAVAFYDKLKEAGCDAEIQLYEGKPHGWFNKEPDRTITLNRMEKFIVKRFDMNSCPVR